MFPKFKAWFVVHNRVIAGYTALVVFVVILLVGILLTLKEDEKEQNQGKARSTLVRSRSFKTGEKCSQTLEDICTFRCGEITPEDDLVDEINQKMTNCKDTKIKLVIGNISFEEGVLPKNWLEGLKAEIIQLILTESNLLRITEGAFLNVHFALNHLSILNSKMIDLQKHYFTGLNNLAEFEFKFNEVYSGLVWIEKGTLDVLPNLQTLSMEHCLTCEEQVANLTGGEGDPLNLVSLSFQQNSFHKLTSASLRRATQIQNLYLQYNNLSELSDEFLWSPKLSQIHIQYNNLATLQDGIFDGLPNNYQVFAGYNPWKCDCDLLWLQDLALINNTPIKQPKPKCNGVEIQDFNFDNCRTTITPPPTSTPPVTSPPSPTTTTITTPTKPTTATPTRPTTSTTLTTSTTPKPTNLITKCENDLAQLIYKDKIDSSYEPIEIILDGHLTKIGFHDLNEDSLRTTALNISGPNERYRLFFLHPEKKCYEFSMKLTILLDLNRSATYTMCLSDDLLSCFALKVKPGFGERAWLLNNQKYGIIGGAAGTAAASLFLLGLGMFYYIRQHPELLKGNKRVIIVRRKEALVMPKYYNNPNFTPGYLTPNTPLYERINYGNRHKHRGSDNSDSSDYIRAEISLPPPLPQRTGQPFIIS